MTGSQAIFCAVQQVHHNTSLVRKGGPWAYLLIVPFRGAAHFLEDGIVCQLVQQPHVWAPAGVSNTQMIAGIAQLLLSDGHSHTGREDRNMSKHLEQPGMS